jgi:uncharacterized membrane protein (UPF0127 family)
MKFPIDIIWLDSNGKIVHIVENLEPCPLVFVCPSYAPNTDSQYVLETVAGFIPRHNVSVGTDVDFELVRLCFRISNCISNLNILMNSIERCVYVIVCNK